MVRTAPVTANEFAAGGRGGWAIHLLLVGAIFVGGVAYLRWMPQIRMDRDEGINLIKVRLVSDGFKLYRDIWSDQPPGFTSLLQGWTWLFGDSLPASRTLPLACSCLLMLAAARLTSRLGGPAAGALVIIVLLAARRYAALSMSLMIGLPSIALALASIWMISAAGRRFAPAMMAAGGATMAAALNVKLFAFMLLPLTLAVMLAQRRDTFTGRIARRGLIGDLLAWSAGFAAVSAIVFIVYGPYESAQLLAPHIGGSETYARKLVKNAVKLLEFAAQDAPLFLFASAALVMALIRRDARYLLPYVWSLTSTIALLHARPVWSHHRLMLSIPLAAICALGAVDMLRALGRPGASAWVRWAATGLCLIALAGTLGWRLAALAQPGVREGKRIDAEALAMIRSRAAATNWVFADEPFYVVLAGLRTPPELAVLSAKRRDHGHLSDKRIIELLEKYRPELALIERFEAEYSPLLHSYFNSHYTVIHAQGNTKLMERKSG